MDVNARVGYRVDLSPEEFRLIRRALRAWVEVLKSKGVPVDGKMILQASRLEDDLKRRAASSAKAQLGQMQASLDDIDDHALDATPQNVPYAGETTYPPTKTGVK